MVNIAEVVIGAKAGDRVRVTYKDGTKQALRFECLAGFKQPAWVVVGSNPLLVVVRREIAIAIGEPIHFHGGKKSHSVVTEIDTR